MAPQPDPPPEREPRARPAPGCRAIDMEVVEADWWSQQRAEESYQKWKDGLEGFSRLVYGGGDDD